MTKRIGILGFGIVGRSILEFLHNSGNSLSSMDISIWDKREACKDEIEFVQNFKANYLSEKDLDIKAFVDKHQKIFVSPGFNLSKIFNKEPVFYKNRFWGELDLLPEQFAKKSIGITGTLGKTSITTLLHALSNITPLNSGKCIKAVKGGNIGIPMLSFSVSEKYIDLAFLELSSFQLSYNKKFAPKVAILNNFFPNHLDWHIDLNDYFRSKLKLFEYQVEGQYSIFSGDFLLKKFLFPEDFFLKLKSDVSFVFESFDLAMDCVEKFPLKRGRVFYKDSAQLFEAKIVSNKIFDNKKIFDLNYLPDISFETNWLFVLAAMRVLDFDFYTLQKIIFNKELLFLSEFKKKFGGHRLEHFATINGVDFYNDSKATVLEATQKALEKLDKNGKPIILILGGLSKGVDRKVLLNFLTSLKNLKKVLCFGKDCEEFKIFSTYSSLDAVVNATLNFAKDGDQVLFSPSGSSFDLFDNYEHRGNSFKDKILTLGSS